MYCSFLDGTLIRAEINDELVKTFNIPGFSEDSSSICSRSVCNEMTEPSHSEQKEIKIIFRKNYT
jgi:hypothetical protein